MMILLMAAVTLLLFRTNRHIVRILVSCKRLTTLGDYRPVVN